MPIPGGLGADATGKVDLNSDLIRKRWVLEGLIQEQSKSFWAPYKGTSSSSLIYQVNDFGGTRGNQVIFDYDGNLTGKAVRGKDTAYGKGEQKKKFSDKLTTERFRFVVDNGDKFDGAEIGDDRINEHSDSRQKLADLWVRHSDQAVNDVLQQASDFIIDLGDTFTFDQFLDIETTIKNGRGFTTAPAGYETRLPLKPFNLANGDPVWVVVLDSYMKNMLLKSTGAQTLLRDADLRGNQNRVIKGQIGKIGNFLFVEAGNFFGTTLGTILDTNQYYNFDNTSVEIAGLRQKDANGKWTGEAGFTFAGELTSRALILGQNAIQLGVSKAPDYKFQASQDFGIKSESALEVWTGIKPAKLKDENSDYEVAKVAGYNYGFVALDCKVKK